MKHPLTFQDVAEISKQRLLTMELCDDMRAAADWQLEQVMKWLDEHLTNYSDADYLGSCESINDLEDHLKKAMRPQEDN